MISNSVGVTSFIVLTITHIIFWMSQNNYFPNIDTNIFKDSHVRFLDWLSNYISTSYVNDTNHIVHIKQTHACCLCGTWCCFMHKWEKSLLCARYNTWECNLKDSLNCKVRDSHSNTHLIWETLGVEI